jgi:AcrR family transcriptional regulator
MQLETLPALGGDVRDNGGMSELLEQRRFAATRPLPRGPHSLTREQVAANQRRRLLEGMIDAIGEKGYAASTVSDVIKRAGVSRKAFYEHFLNKDECFLATYDSIAAAGQRGACTALAGRGTLQEGVQAALGDLFELAIARPEALRVLTVEIGAARPAGIERREQLVVGYEEVLRESLGLERGPGSIPNPVLRCVVGGILHVLYAQLRRGEHRRLRERLPDLVSWSTAYWPAPESIVRSLWDATPPKLDLTGGRAPGSLSLGASSSRLRRLPRGENGTSRSFVVHSQRERILDAVTNLTARSGYSALTVEGIATEASVSLQAFYQHFCDKEDAFLVAYDIGHDKALALVEQAYRSEPDWRHGVRAAIAALFRFLAAEPAYAQMALVDVLAATERSTERAFRGAASYAQMLLPGLDRGPAQGRPPDITLQAITGGLFELALHHAMQRRMHELPAMIPRATFFALAPFIGAQEASEVATAPGEARAAR